MQAIHRFLDQKRNVLAALMLLATFGIYKMPQTLFGLKMGLFALVGAMGVWLIALKFKGAATPENKKRARTSLFLLIGFLLISLAIFAYTYFSTLA